MNSATRFSIQDRSEYIIFMCTPYRRPHRHFPQDVFKCTLIFYKSLNDRAEINGRVPQKTVYRMGLAQRDVERVMLSIKLIF